MSDNEPPADQSLPSGRAIVHGILGSRDTAAEASPSGQLYRAIEEFHRVRALDVDPQFTDSLVRSNMPSPSPNDSSRRLNSTTPGAGEYINLPPPPPPRMTPAEPLPGARTASRAAFSAYRRSRPQLSRPQHSQLQRGHEQARQLVSGSSEQSPSGIGLADLHNAGRQLEAASSNLRALLDEPVPSLSSPALSARDHSDGAEHNRRAKRRKLDTESITATPFQGFTYGQYGQVEPGKLKMEIVSCDGGIYEESHCQGNYAAENVLRSDATVYCTKSSRCNLVLRHQGATIFSLQELIIKAPHSGYTAPVQEGMVFISMTSDELLTRTAQYQIQYSPPRPPRTAAERAEQLTPLPAVRSIRHSEDGSTMTNAQRNVRRLYDVGQQDEDCELRTALIPSDFTVNVPPFQVTTECSDSEEEMEQRPIPRRRMRSGSEDDTEERGAPRSAWLSGRSFHDPHMPPRFPSLQRRETLYHVSLAEAAEASQIASQEAVKAVGGELMVPHARFFIERDKSKCTVRFDPPVSGRFILLKMWSPHHSPTGNIDIQSVVAKGFAGPRFFPAITMR